MNLKREWNYKMKIRKTRFLLVAIPFLCALLFQPYVYYGFESDRTISIICQTSYIDYIHSYSFPKNIELSTPLHSRFELYPVVILLPGDDMSSYSMNSLKMEFLRNGYMVVTMNIPKYDTDVFFILNSTVDYLLSRTDVNSSQIGILGHSHGADYAILFATFRNESIHAVVAANFGPIQYMLSDYYPIYRNVVIKNKSLPDTYSEFLKDNNSLTLPMNLTTPNNLLLINDKFDLKIRSNPDLYLHYYIDGNYNQSQKVYGDFTKGTARELLIENSLFGHASGIYSTNGISAAISWMNRALQVPDAGNNYSYAIFLSTFFMLPFLSLLVNLVIKLVEKLEIFPRLKEKYRLH